MLHNEPIHETQITIFRRNPELFEKVLSGLDLKTIASKPEEPAGQPTIVPVESGPVLIEPVPPRLPPVEVHITPELCTRVSVIGDLSKAKTMKLMRAVGERTSRRVSSVARFWKHRNSLNIGKVVPLISWDENLKGFEFSWIETLKLQLANKDIK